MGGACPSTLRADEAGEGTQREGSRSGSRRKKHPVDAIIRMFKKADAAAETTMTKTRRPSNVDESSVRSGRRGGAPIAEVEDGSVRVGDLHMLMNQSSLGSSSSTLTRRGKLNVWSAGYGSVPKNVEMTISAQSFRPTLPTPTMNPPTRLDPPDFDELKCLRTLGVGSFGRVTLMEHVPSQTVLAMKRMSRAFIKKYRHEETARREREIMGGVDNPFLSRLVASYSGDKCLYILMDWCQGGELLVQLERQETGRFHPENVAFYIAGISVGLMYLHDRGVVFRGVMPENVMIAGDGYPVLIDFGFSKKIGVNGRTHTLVGAPDYIAPEILMRQKRDEGYGHMVDYWSLGCLTFELLTGVPPFSPGGDEYKQKVYGAIEKRVTSRAPLRWVGTRLHPVPAVAKNFVDLLLDPDPNVRLGGKTNREGKPVLMQHDFMLVVAAHGRWEDIVNKVVPAPPLSKGKNNLCIPTADSYDAGYFEPQMEMASVMNIGKMGWSAMKDVEKRKEEAEGAMSSSSAPDADVVAEVQAENVIANANAADEMAALEADWDALYGVPASELELIVPQEERYYQCEETDKMFSTYTGPDELVVIDGVHVEGLGGGGGGDVKSKEEAVRQQQLRGEELRRSLDVAGVDVALEAEANGVAAAQEAEVTAAEGENTQEDEIIFSEAGSVAAALEAEVVTEAAAAGKPS